MKPCAKKRRLTKSRPAKTKAASTSPRPVGRPPKYEWSRLFNGVTWIVQPGDHGFPYSMSARRFAAIVHNQAKRLGVKASISEREGEVVIQAKVRGA